MGNTDIKLCECGCGAPAPIAKRTRSECGWIKGQPIRFIHGHQMIGRIRSKEARENIALGKMGNKNPNWKGHTKDKFGYILIYVGADHPMSDARKYCYEHRLVMAENIGRMLRPEEVVHHKLEIEGGSGDVSDNRIENLILFSNQTDHMNYHAKISKSPIWTLMSKGE